MASRVMSDTNTLPSSYILRATASSLRSLTSKMVRGVSVSIPFVLSRHLLVFLGRFLGCSPLPTWYVIIVSSGYNDRKYIHSLLLLLRNFLIQSL